MSCISVEMTFQTPDLWVVATLVLLEGLLSADNALVLALLVRHLPDKQQQKALSLGMTLAFVLRGVGIALAGYLIRFWWLCGLGALYLLGLALKHFLQRRRASPPEQVVGAGMSYARTVVMVGFTDVVFAIDSILIAVALINSPKKLWIVYVGGTLGLILLRLASSIFIRLLHRYPALDHTAYALVGWAGVKLFLAAGHMSPTHFLPELPKWVFWSGFALILVVGGLVARKEEKRTSEPNFDR
jgi:YkoY family integral membrane protein